MASVANPVGAVNTHEAWKRKHLLFLKKKKQKDFPRFLHPAPPAGFRTKG